ncbi:jerky protein-like [Ruditapes philippinarum]|uniref:jerky protein-like n=1 Tax=Ruditapes philippinarum TaxID=129788 RepID=UPI00295BF3C4|nr:jerky protein-like [Ruditapes philippinarum]
MLYKGIVDNRKREMTGDDRRACENLPLQKYISYHFLLRDSLISNGCLEKPGCIWNADETGFNIGANKSKVIGPSRKDIPVPQISAGKQRLTVMYCGNASGQMMPPLFVFPEPKPRAYDPLNRAPEGNYIAYTKKGRMDGTTFSKFSDHFDKVAGIERPVVLLLDNVGSHISQEVFVKAKKKDILLYRIVPNTTHLMQPFDKVYSVL